MSQLYTLITVKYGQIDSFVARKQLFTLDICAEYHTVFPSTIFAYGCIPRYQLSRTTCQAAEGSNESEESPCLLNQAWQREGGEEASGLE